MQADDMCRCSPCPATRGCGSTAAAPLFSRATRMDIGRTCMHRQLPDKIRTPQTDTEREGERERERQRETERERERQGERESERASELSRYSRTPNASNFCGNAAAAFRPTSRTMGLDARPSLRPCLKRIVCKGVCGVI